MIDNEYNKVKQSNQENIKDEVLVIYEIMKKLVFDVGVAKNDYFSRRPLERLFIMGVTNCSVGFIYSLLRIFSPSPSERHLVFNNLDTIIIVTFLIGGMTICVISSILEFLLAVYRVKIESDMTHTMEYVKEKQESILNKL